MRLALYLAIQYLRHQPYRTFVLGSAIAAACLSAVLLMSLSNGVHASLIRSSTALVGGYVNVTGIFKPREDKQFNYIPDVKLVRKAIEEKVPNIESIVERHRFPVRITNADKELVVPGTLGIDLATDSQILGALHIPPQREGGPKVVDGDLSRLKELDTIALFEKQADILKVGVGSVVALTTITMRNVSNTVDARVVAVLGNVGIQTNWYSFVNKRTMAGLLGAPADSAGLISIRLRDIDQTESARAAVVEALRGVGLTPIPALQVTERARAAVYNGQAWSGSRLAVSTWEEELWANHWVIDVMAAIHVSLLIIICIVMGVGIANASVMAARERTPQIGLLRALGIPRPRVMVQMLIEMLILAVIAGGVGTGLGMALVKALDAMQLTVQSDTFVNGSMSNKLSFLIDWHVIVALLGSTALVSVLGSAVGGFRALRVEPTVAIRQVD